jgi:cellulose synthase/poly-beta-1,6-N-acetylglucosamine synthase-like glycosyltransferase
VILTLLIVIAAALYLSAAIYLALGIRAQYATRDDLPPITVVVPIRNEEQALPGLLESLLRLDYPADRIELILVDDQSTDRTVEIAESYRSRLPYTLRIIDVTTANVETLTAKTRPLAAGIEAAKTEVILMTDADCRVGPRWARAMAGRFADGVGMVCGCTLPMEREHPSLLARFEILDWMFLLGVCVGFSGKRNAQALIGNNYAVRASTYRRLGTYRSIPHNKVDDIALMLAVKSDGRERIVMPADADLVARTEPLGTMRELVGQRYRWIKAWPFARPAVQAVLAVGIATHIVWPLAAILLGAPALLLLAAAAIGDSVVISAMAGRVTPGHDYRLTPAYALFATLYGWWLTLMIVSGRKIEWKQREF